MTIVAPARKPDVHEHLHAVDVEERQHGDEGLVLVAASTRAERLRDVRDEVAVREHHALRQAGRARRVRQHDDVVEVDRHLLRERLADSSVNAAIGVVAVGLTDDVHLLDRRVRDRRRGAVSRNIGIVTRTRRARVDELVVHLAARCRSG